MERRTHSTLRDHPHQPSPTSHKVRPSEPTRHRLRRRRCGASRSSCTADRDLEGQGVAHRQRRRRVEGERPSAGAGARHDGQDRREEVLDAVGHAFGARPSRHAIEPNQRAGIAVDCFLHSWHREIGPQLDALYVRSPPHEDPRRKLNPVQSRHPSMKRALESPHAAAVPAIALRPLHGRALRRPLPTAALCAARRRAALAAALVPPLPAHGRDGMLVRAACGNWPAAARALRAAGHRRRHPPSLREGEDGARGQLAMPTWIGGLWRRRGWR